jgi:hypothetical protein
MITNTGKNILAKYLVGQAPAYASYIAVGCGPQAVDRDLGDFGDYSAKESLDFEMFRSPIISRGYVKEGGIDKIVLTAELPTEERYEITEVGVFSAGSNPSATTTDSRLLYGFTQTENWEYHSAELAQAISSIYTPLDGDANDDVSIGEYDLDLDGTLEDYPVFQTNADNRIFTSSERVARNERCRFLNNIMMIRGDMSDISSDVAGRLTVDSGNHVHLNGISVGSFDKQSPADEIRFAFSLVNKDGQTAAVPDEVRIILEFASGEGATLADYDYARMEMTLENGTGTGQYDFSENRYFVLSSQLQQMFKSANFSWNAMTLSKIYLSVIDNGIPSDQYYIAIDAIRMENLTTKNPLYGLTGYSVIKSVGALPIVKVANTTNYMEFRFAVGID